jgi:hypothetical protein
VDARGRGLGDPIGGGGAPLHEIEGFLRDLAGIAGRERAQDPGNGVALRKGDVFGVCGSVRIVN